MIRKLSNVTHKMKPNFKPTSARVHNPCSFCHIRPPSLKELEAKVQEAAKFHGIASWIETGQIDKAGKLKGPKKRKTCREVQEIAKSMYNQTGR